MADVFHKAGLQDTPAESNDRISCGTDAGKKRTTQRAAGPLLSTAFLHGRLTDHVFHEVIRMAEH